MTRSRLPRLPTVLPIFIALIAGAFLAGCVTREEPRDGFAGAYDLIREDAVRRNPALAGRRLMVAVRVVAVDDDDPFPECTGGCGCTCVSGPGEPEVCTPCECEPEGCIIGQCPGLCPL